jgi:predicted NAD/FAD-dependent oxidoreductase
MPLTGQRVAIIGAGLAGLACATRLGEDGVAVSLFDKARGPGGRMSVRRIETPSGEAAFDHGAQYFTVRGASFRDQVTGWAADGVAAPWPAAGPEAWVGVLHTTEGPGDRFDAVVVAVPAEQAAVLLRDHDPALTAAAAESVSQPCWTVMAAFDRRLDCLPDVLRDAGPLGWAARNGAKPGRGPVEAWVLQGSPDWSRDHLEDPAEAVSAALLAALAEAAGGPLPAPVAVSAHRWRYARSAPGAGAVLWSAATGLGCCGDWVNGPRVEAAWDSGVALAERMLAGG